MCSFTFTYICFLEIKESKFRKFGLNLENIYDFGGPWCVDIFKKKTTQKKQPTNHKTKILTKLTTVKNGEICHKKKDLGLFKN